MTDILLVEDSVDCQVLVNRALNELARITVAPNIEHAKRLLDSNDYALLILDVTLPDGNGFALCSSLMADKGIRRPRVIFLTGARDIADKLTGFSVGGDDFLVKPFDFRELKARVKAHLRAREEAIQTAQDLKVGNLTLSLADYSAEICDTAGITRLDLTATEFRLLFALAKNLGRILSRDQLLDAASGGKEEIADRTIDAHLCRIRKKLTRSSYELQAVYGIGYRLAPKVAG